MLSDATFDHFVELSEVGPTRAHKFLQSREEAGGGSCRVFATQHWGSKLGGLGRFSKHCF